MPESPTANMGLITASVSSDDNAWGQLTNDAFARVDTHDHTPGNGVTIPVAGLNINDTLVMGSHAISEVEAVTFVNEGGAAGTERALYSRSGELMFRDGSGNQVQLTSAGAINVASSGGFAGDYVGVGAEASFADSTDTYNFKQQDGGGFRQYAKGAFGGLDLYERKTYTTPGVPTTRVRLESPASLAASYTVTFPAAAPGSTSLVQVSSAGTLTFSNTMVRPPLFTSQLPHVVNIWGGHLTGTAGFSAIATSGKHIALGSGGVVYLEIPFADGEIIHSVTLTVNAASSGSIQANLYEYVIDTATTTGKASGASSASGAVSTFTITPGTTYTAASNTKMTLVVNSSTGATNNLYSVVINKRTA